MPFSGVEPFTHTCSFPIRPAALIPCEHMFRSSRTSTLAQRALGALRLTRSFLLLEDDQDVDWEVDWDEQSRADHPHRAPLRRRFAAERHARRRPGQPEPVAHVCLCPVGGCAPVAERRERASRTPPVGSLGWTSG